MLVVAISLDPQLMHGAQRAVISETLGGVFLAVSTTVGGERPAAPSRGMYIYYAYYGLTSINTVFVLFFCVALRYES